MTTPECGRVKLVEAFHDGRLGAQESAAMERHIAGCGACAELARDLDRIGEALRAPRDPATPLEHQRARLGLLRRAAEAPAPRDRFASGAGRFVLAAAALAAAVALGWIGARTSAGPSLPEVALHLRTPPRLAVPRETTLKPSDDARFDRTRSAGLEVIKLESGTLDVTVRPLAAGERFVVRTADAEVEVRGTALRVQAEKGKILRVTVVEGSVEVRYAGFSAVIPSGGSWQATGDAPAASAPAPSSATPAAAAPPPVAAAPPRIAARTRERAPEHVEPGPVAQQPRPVETASSSAPPPPPPPPASSPASRAFADAMSALRRGDFAGGAAQLESFSGAYGGDARADEADYLRAIALQRAGRKADASAAAKRYLSAHPSGAHRSEAKQIAGE